MSSFKMSRKVFLRIAEAYGFDPTDSHVEELYEWVLDSFRSLDQLDELDLSQVSLDPAFFPNWE